MIPRAFPSLPTSAAAVVVALSLATTTGAQNVSSLLPESMPTLMGLFTAPALEFSENVALTIPDNNPIGLARSIVLPASPYPIESIGISLEIAGGANGDLYAYVVHDTGFAVLLNRVGRTAGNPSGYLDAGMTVSFSETAEAGDIHRYRETLGGVPVTGFLTGNWQPDGRDVDPGLTLDSDPRTATLSSFQGLDAEGTWTLFVADMDAGGESTLNRWSILVTPVPEFSTTSLGVAALLGGWALLRRRRIRTEMPRP